MSAKQAINDKLQCNVTTSLMCSRAYSKRVPRTNCALRVKKCAPRIFSGIYFFAQVN